MPTRRVFLIALLMAASGWAVASLGPQSHTIRIVSSVTPTPIPAPSPEPRDVLLWFAGDVMLSRSVGDAMAARNDWTWPFALVASATRTPDLMFVNLETTVSSRGVLSGCAYCFRADPKSVAGLQHAGIDIVSLANNHTWDYGLEALEDTMTHLASAGVAFVGAGADDERARAPLIRTVGGVRIAYLAFTDLLPVSAQATGVRAGVNRYDEERMASDIARARGMADIVIVSFHTGTEYEPRHNPVQERIYRAAIDAGADIVVGHHPHVVQDTERYGRGWVFYSMGNFVFDQNFSDETRRGELLQVTVRNGAIASVATASVDISRTYQPSLVR